MQELETIETFSFCEIFLRQWSICLTQGTVPEEEPATLF